MYPDAMTTQQDDVPPQILTLAEVSALTRVPVATLRYLRQRGEGPPLFRLAGRLVAYQDEVVAWLEASRSQAHPPRRAVR